MTVSMGIKHRGSGRYEIVSIATSAQFTSDWLPACALLGLRFVSRFHDGSLGVVDKQDLYEIVAELNTMRSWATAKERTEDMTLLVERIDDILRALQETSWDDCEYDFG